MISWKSSLLRFQELLSSLPHTYNTLILSLTFIIFVIRAWISRVDDENGNEPNISNVESSRVNCKVRSKDLRHNISRIWIPRFGWGNHSQKFLITFFWNCRPRPRSVISFLSISKSFPIVLLQLLYCVLRPTADSRHCYLLIYTRQNPCKRPIYEHRNKSRVHTRKQCSTVIH